MKKFEDAVTDYHRGGSEVDDPGRPGTVEAVAFDSARSSFYSILAAYGIGEGDEVIIPAFTCLVITNPVIWVGAKPVYIDTGDDFNMDLSDLKKKVTKNTKAVLVQHTFGKPIDVGKVREIVGEDVKIIEDTAHCLGGELNGRKLGTLGDAAILTFGIEKIISTVRGGMAITNDQELAIKLRQRQIGAKRFGLRRLIASLINPVFWWFVTPVYYLGIGKLTLGRIFAWIGHRISLFGNMIEDCEYESKMPAWIPARLPGALATLGSLQMKKLDSFNAHRMKIASIYESELGISYPSDLPVKNVVLRFPVLVDDRHAVLQAAKKIHVVLGDWYKSILYAPEFTWRGFEYIKGMAPNAERLSAMIVNLPTGVNVSVRAAKKIAGLVRKFR
ncbi:MAG: DegT/DnrJ/EryC1/StrS family aminotransferase [Candidatus Dojkabacteria bacterium]